MYWHKYELYIMKHLRYNYRIYPTVEQQSMLNQIGGSCRYIWNYYLNKEMERYKLDNKFNFFNKNSKDLTSLKQNIEWLKIPPAIALQQTIRNLDQSLRQSFKNANSRKGFPTFKKKKFNSVSLYNILKEGIGQEVPEYKPVEIPLSGDQSIDPRYVSMKQEQDPTIIAGGCYGL